MIQPQELRIGNLVCYNPKLSSPQTTLSSTLVEVTAVFPDKIGYTFPNLDHRVEPFEDDLLQTQVRYRLLTEVEPVPLSHQWLEQCGFAKKPDSLYQKGNFFFQDPMHTTSSGTFPFGIIDRGVIASLKYVHQLQNLYFMLSGEDLEISGEGMS